MAARLRIEAGDGVVIWSSHKHFQKKADNDKRNIHLKNKLIVANGSRMLMKQYRTRKHLLLSIVEYPDTHLGFSTCMVLCYAKIYVSLHNVDKL